LRVARLPAPKVQAQSLTGPDPVNMGCSMGCSIHEPSAPPECITRTAVHSDTPVLPKAAVSNSCEAKCGRPAAAGYRSCCRTCKESNGAKHGPQCEARCSHLSDGPCDAPKALCKSCCCGRPAAAGHQWCCRTCKESSGAKHGPRCEALVNNASDAPRSLCKNSSCGRLAAIGYQFCCHSCEKSRGTRHGPKCDDDHNAHGDGVDFIKNLESPGLECMEGASSKPARTAAALGLRVNQSPKRVEAAKSVSVSSDCGKFCIKATTGENRTLIMKTVGHRTNTDDNDLFQPIQLSFSDNQQPEEVVKVELKLPQPVEFGRAITLNCWEDEEFDRGMPAKEVENGQVYISLQDRRMIHAFVPHFSTFSFKLASNEVKIEQAGELDPRFDRTYMNQEENKCMSYTRGGMPYFLPANFQRQAIKIDDWSTWENEPVGYHGCNIASAKIILKEGFKSPSERGALTAKPGHWHPSETHFDVPRWGDACFLSPSSKYCCAKGYGDQDGCILLELRQTGELMVDSTMTCKSDRGEDLVVFFLLQCRMKSTGLTKVPGTENKVFQGTTPKVNNCDHRVSSKGMEYRLATGKDIKPYGALMRTMPAKDVVEWMQNNQAL